MHDEPGVEDALRPWFWEGNVQRTAIDYLQRQGWSILRASDTARKSPGKDIEAERSGTRLWVTVKGYPTGTPRTNPSTQSRHWFSHAIFDVVLYRSSDPDVEIAVALPDFKTYRNLASRISWFRQETKLWLIWVSESHVMVEQPNTDGA